MAIDPSSPYVGTANLLRNAAVEEVDVSEAGPNGQDYALALVTVAADPAFVISEE